MEHLQTIYLEVATSNAPVCLEILGVNQVGLEASNGAMTQGITLPWLQDVRSNSVWTAWNVSHRDFFILDGLNRISAIYNLTTHDLNHATNRENLKALLLMAGRWVDTDGDHLSDDWEQIYFRGLGALANGDDDQDGLDNLSEFTFGTNPKSAGPSAFVPRLVQDQGHTFLELTFHRRGGAQLNYVVETSTDLLNWSADETAFEVVQPFVNLYDRTGTGRSICRVAAPVEDGPRVFLRVRGELP